MRPPRITPWKKAASVEPSQKARSHHTLLVRATQRNSKATPRNTSASSIRMTGR
jgi:hypothetical protein